MQLERLVHHGDPAAIPPVETWHPPLLGDLPVTILADGQWLHQGRPFTRPALVRLLASLLRQDAEGVCLVTPEERWRLSVEDCPFVIVQAEQHGDDWWLTTQYGDRLCLGQSHCLALTDTPQGDRVPQVRVRHGLMARVSRNVYYQLVEAAQLLEGQGGCMKVGLWSGGQWQPMGSIDASEVE
jgi:hypothetical protein